MGNRIEFACRRAVARRRPALAGLCAAVALSLAGPAAAQTVVGAKPEPSVIVDLSVLDQLGPAPTLPEKLRPTVGVSRRPPGFGRGYPAATAGRPRLPLVPGAEAGAPGDRIVLKPPSGVNKKKRTGRTGAKAQSARRPGPGKPPTRSGSTKRAPAKPSVSVAKLPPPPKVPPARKTEGSEPRAAPMEKPAPSGPPPARPAPIVRVAPETPPSPPAAAGESMPPKSPEIARMPAPEIKPPPPPPVATPPAAVKPAPRTETAALPSSPPEIGPGRSLLIRFDGDSAKLDREATRTLKSVAQAMADDEELRLQLLAYANGSSQSASRSRRLSLSRALAARSYLIGQGVRSTRIDVRALGNKTEGGPPDRIDVIVTKR